VSAITELYSNMGGVRPGQPGAAPWYSVDRSKPSELARTLMETVKDVERRQPAIFDGNRRHARIYAGYLPRGLSWSSSGSPANDRVPFRATKALVRGICDTATALISRFRPKSTLITIGAEWDVVQQAQDMDKFLSGAYEVGDLYPTAARSFHDSTVFGTGGWKYVPKGDGDDWRVCYERFLPDDLVIDEDECRDHLNPENTYHRVVVKGDALIRRFASGNSREATARRVKIRAACSTTSWPNRSVPKDSCILVDAVHLDPEGGDHRHVVAIEGLTLLDETWPYDFHPYTFLWWVPPLSGFYGDGIAYRQYGRQERITYMHRWIERCHDLFANPKVFLDPRGGPPAMQMSNEIGTIVSTTRQPYFMTQQQVVPPEVYRWLDKLAMDGMEDEGMNQAMVGNTLPPGVDSAPAQRELSFKESNRVAPVSQRWEHAVAVDAAYKTIAMYARRAGQVKKPPAVRWAERKRLVNVEFPDLPRDAYVIRPAPSSFETMSPALRLQSAIELASTNWLRPGEGRALLGHPDLERADELDNAPKRYADMVLQRLLKGERVEVDEYADLVVLDATVRAGRLWAVERGAPDEIVDNCSDFLDRLDRQVEGANQAMAGGVPPGPTSPGGGTSAPAGPLEYTGGSSQPPTPHI
jgi:hypothetical protein